jgi:hypothetical protein
MPTAAQPVLDESKILISDISPLLFGGIMLILMMTTHAIFTEIVAYIRDRRIEPLMAKKRVLAARPYLYLCNFLLLTAHLAEITLWAYALSLSGLVPDFHKALFFSGSTYTTLGYGNDIMPEDWNSVTMVIAISGMFTIAWTTSFIMGLIGLFHNRTVTGPDRPETVR